MTGEGVGQISRGERERNEGERGGERGVMRVVDVRGADRDQALPPPPPFPAPPSVLPPLPPPRSGDARRVMEEEEEAIQDDKNAETVLQRAGDVQRVMQGCMGMVSMGSHYIYIYVLVLCMCSHCICSHLTAWEW